jgi:cytochrome c oxidase subunit 2
VGRKQGIKPGRLVKLIGLMGLVALVASGCTADEGLHFGWPAAITPQGVRMRDFWMWAVFASLAVGLVVWGLTIWTVSFHRKRKGRDDVLPRQFQYSGSLEFILVVVPLVIVSVLFYFTLTTQDFVLKKVPNPNLKVGVIAFQWNWEFDYQGYQTPDGQTVKTIGNSEEIPVLVLPTDETIEYDLRSTDVVHSFFVPAFNFKRDVFPGNVENKFQTTITVPGAFVGRCAELCGTYHSMMNFELRAVTPETYEAFLAAKKQGMSTPDALSSIGEKPFASTTSPFDTKRTAELASN